MRHSWPSLFSGKVALLAALTVVVTACGTGGGQSSGNIPSDRAGLINAFPSDVRSLLTDDIPTPVIAALLKVRNQGPNTIVDDDGGGELFKGEQDAYINNWQKLTGWTVKNLANPQGPGEVKAQVDSGHPQWNFFETGSNGDAMTEEQQGLLAKLDTTLMNSVESTFPKSAGYAYTDYWIQYSFFGVVVLWDLHKWPMSGTHPTSALDLFNTSQFPGKRCLYKFPEYAGTLEYPLLADGVSGKALYPLDAQRAFRKLNTIKSQIVWWDSGAASVQNIVNGDCAMGTTWNGRPATRLRTDPSTPIGYTWKDVLLIDSGWAIPKGASHQDAVNSLLAYDFTAKNQCRFINALGYGIPIDESCINDFGKTWAVTQEHLKETSAKQDPAYYSKNITNLTNQFNTWITS